MSSEAFSTVATTPFKDQKPGTSGLRKKVTVFQQPHYLANFVQATFNVLRSQPQGIPERLVVGGDGRFFCLEACQIILKIAAANGVKHCIVGHNAILSTPAVSAVIRNRKDEAGLLPQGAFILTASHNPGGPTEDFGIKYNGTNGGPANETLTDAINQQTLVIASYQIATFADVDLATLGHRAVTPAFAVTVIDSTEDYVALLRQVFDFAAIRSLFQRPDFSFTFDAMNGVGGPYAVRIFHTELGAPLESLVHCTPLPDFGHLHPDPNLTYATDLVAKMGLEKTGKPKAGVDAATVPQFGAASDGDADRNMILGRQFFVSPSDSVAIIAANAQCIPFFAGGVKAVARSMPTSAALDLVAKQLGIPCFEVPTGWKFFGNLMDSDTLFGGACHIPLICGEESFGTGSNHVREKDGIWAVLAWLSILAAANADASKPLVTVKELVERHWARFGRNYYMRLDFEGVPTAKAEALMAHVRSPAAGQAAETAFPPLKLVTHDDFRFVDSVDHKVSEKQGVRFVYDDGSRFVFRQSGTSSADATIRVYVERYVSPERYSAGGSELEAEFRALAVAATTVARMLEFTGLAEATVIT